MSFRKLLIIMTFVVTSLTIMLLSTSYAWYQFDTAVTPFTDVQTFDEGLDELSVIFTNSENINTTVAVPVAASDVAEYAHKSTFTVTPSATLLAGKEVAFQIALIDILIDDELVNPYFKYSLLETYNGTTTTIATGDFMNLGESENGNAILLKNMTKVNTLGITYSYEFRVWLEDNGCTLSQINEGVCQNQNDLMGKNFSARIRVSTAAR